MQKLWEKIGAGRKSGVAVPLFSIYSKKSGGIGEIPDIGCLADWAAATGFHILQLLPLNDVGFTYRPYDAESSFALEPVYLSLQDLPRSDSRLFTDDIKDLRKKFPLEGSHVDYGVKKVKLEILGKIFKKALSRKSKKFIKFVQDNAFWLESYAEYKVLKEKNEGRSWLEWPDAVKNRRPEALKAIRLENAEKLEFYRWVQWLLFEQFSQVHEECRGKNVYLMGDLPFLVSRDSADAWAWQDLFKLDFAAGAPPDMCFAGGQEWGMPPYNWPAIEAKGYEYWIQKLRYSGNFYDLYRIDHFVGIFRLWTIPLTGEKKGFFDPPDENIWEAHGRKILSMMLKNTAMLPCAEDLGTVPDCSYKVLHEFGIPGMDIQRWKKTGWKDYFFTPPENYRKNSISAISTHDISPLTAWWNDEASTVDESFIKSKCAQRGFSYEEIKNKLFETDGPKYGRLRWQKSVSSSGHLLEILGLSEHDGGDWLDLYYSSFDEKEKYWKYIGMEGECEQTASPRFAEKALESIERCASIFSVQLLQDWLALAGVWNKDAWDKRINFPGTTNEKNWGILMPLSIEELQKLKANEIIRLIHARTGRSDESFDKSASGR